MTFGGAPAPAGHRHSWARVPRARCRSQFGLIVALCPWYGIFYVLFGHSPLGGKFYLWVQAVKALLTLTSPPFNCFQCPLGHSLIPATSEKAQSCSLGKWSISKRRVAALG